MPYTVSCVGPSSLLVVPSSSDGTPTSEFVDRNIDRRFLVLLVIPRPTTGSPVARMPALTGSEIDPYRMGALVQARLLCAQAMRSPGGRAP